MSLAVRLSSDPNSGGEKSFPITRVDLIRSLGLPIVWWFTLNVSTENLDVDDMPRLAEELEQGPVYAGPMWRDNPIGPSGVVVGLEYVDEARTLLKIEAHATWPEQTDPDPFLPRRRVHRVKSFRDLTKVFQGVADVSTSVGNRLSEEQFLFEDGEHAAVIQDDVSDWELVHCLLAQYFEQESELQFRSLALTGSLSGATGRERRWLIDWAAPEAYGTVKDIDSRIVDTNSLGGFDQFLFSRSDGLHQLGYPTAIRPSIVRSWVRLKGGFDQSRYKEWIAREVPLFLGREGPMAWRVEDRILQPGRPDSASWMTRFHTNPRDVAATTLKDRFGRAKRFTTHWSRIAQVTKSSTGGPWITVQVPGFEAGADELEVRLATPYSGTDGKKGVHLVPEEGTWVMVFWSGRYGDSAIGLANVRGEPTDLDSPSLWLEKASRMHVDDIDIKNVGSVHVESDVAIELDQSSKVDGRRPMELDVNGTQVKLSGGIFHTGKA